MRRIFSWSSFGLIALVAVGAMTYLAFHNYPWLFSTEYTVRIATGPLNEAGDKFIAAFRREMAAEYPRIKFKFVQMADLDESAAALKKGEVNAALVRSDNPMAAEGRTLVIMTKIAAMTVVGPHSDAEDWSDLKDKPIGVLTASGTIDPLQKTVLDFYGVTARQIRPVKPGDVGTEIAAKHIASLLAIGPPGPGGIADAVRSIRTATKKTPKILDFDEADAIAERYPAYEKLDIPQGAFAGAPPVPADSATAIAVTVRLVSLPRLPNYAAGELTRIILATKARMAASEPAAGQIEAPDTDKPVFPIHPGTAAYLSGDKPNLLSDSEDYIYLISMVIGAIGSLGAWLAAMWTRRLHKEIKTRIAALPSYLDVIKSGSVEDLDRIETQLDELSERLVEQYVGEKIPAERYSVIEAKLAEIRNIIGRRRASAGKDPAARVVSEAA